MFMLNDVISEENWKSFGMWLARERQRTGKSKSQAALDAGMDRSQWGRLEKGISGTRRTTIPRIAAAVNVPDSEAYEAAGFSIRKLEDREFQFARRLDRILRCVDEKKRQKIEEFLELAAANYVSALTA